ncbi:MAG: hypothetical protein ACOC0R_04885 [Mariniphaga sp.]
MENKNTIIVLALFGGNKGERVSGAGVYLEKAGNQQLVAYQETGDSGKVTFSHLDKGIYTIILDIPQQTGKLEVKEPWKGEMQVGYHSEKKMYLFREVTGYFSIRFSNFKHITNENITPMYEVIQSRRINGMVVGKIEVAHKTGSLTLELAAYSFRNFNKLVEKYKYDAAMSVIRKSS